MKKKIDNRNILYPMPVTIIGTLVDKKVNFINIAHVGILNSATPHLISLGMNKTHYSNIGIRENKTFSVNIPSRGQMIETDYVGLVSGRQIDKSNVFKVYYGDLKTAPILTDCPLSMECRLVDIFDVKTHDVFIGEVVNTYAEHNVLTDGRVDLLKVDPLLFDMHSVQYWSIGEAVGKCWNAGRQYDKHL